MVSVSHNVTSCSFHGGPVRLRPDRSTAEAVALQSGLFGVSLQGPVVKDAMRPDVVVFVGSPRSLRRLKSCFEVTDPPVINYIWPTVLFQEPDRRLYAGGLSKMWV